MAVRMEKPWIDLTPEAAKALPGQLGVYQLADAEGRVHGVPADEVRLYHLAAAFGHQHESTAVQCFFLNGRREIGRLFQSVGDAAFRRIQC